MRTTPQMLVTHASLVLGTLALSCGRTDGYCSPFSYDAPPVALKLLDEEGEPVCLKGTRFDPAYVVSNALIPSKQVPEDRDAGFNELLDILQDKETCEYTLVGWYDPGRGEALAIRLEPKDYEPVTFQVEFSRKGECHEALAEPVTLVLTHQ